MIPDPLWTIVFGGLVSVCLFFLRGVARDVRRSNEILAEHETRITVLETLRGE
jgi:hypothetical protein